MLSVERARAANSFEVEASLPKPNQELSIVSILSRIDK